MDRLGNEMLESSTVERGLGVVVVGILSWEKRGSAAGEFGKCSTP